MEAVAIERRTVDRRRGRARFHVPERRTGFDRRDATRRRRDALLAAYRDRTGLIVAVLAAIVALNGADLALTHVALGRGATEVNPVMAAWFAAGTAPAALFKLSVGAAVAGGLWALRRYRTALAASLGIAAGLALVVAYLAAGVVAGA